MPSSETLHCGDDSGSLDARLGDALDAIRDAVLIVDANGALVDVNRAAEESYGYSRAELLRLNIRDMRAVEALGGLDQQLRAAIEGGVTFETRHVRKDGSTFPVEVSSSPFAGAVPGGVISVIRDVSRRKENEKLRANLLEQVSESNARFDGALTLLSSAVGAPTLPSLLESTVTALSQVMGADGALFIVRDGDTMRVSAQTGSSGWAPVGLLLRHGEGFCGRVVEAGVPLYVADIQLSAAVRSEHRVAGLRSMFGVPVFVDDELFGVLECAWVDERPVDDAESSMVKLAAERIALAISGARMLERSRRGERLNAALIEASNRLSASFELGPALNDVLEIGCAALECDTALLGRAARGEWRVEHARGFDMPAEGLAFDERLLGAMSSERPFVFTRAEGQHEDWLSSRVGLVEAVVTPIPAHRGVGGALVFGRSDALHGFDDQATDFVHRLAQSVALSLANAAQFEAEHHIAETLQEALLLMPAAVPGLEYAHLYRSATLSTRVGGDFFDIFEMAEGRVGVLVGDVSGRGLEAAVLTSIIKDTIRAFAHDTPSPAAALERANITLGEAAKLPDFASVFYAVIDRTTGFLTYCNAGHPPAVVVAPTGEVRLLEGTSPIIGAFPDLSYVDCTVEIGVEDTVLLYTDGVTEARDLSGAFFAEERLVAMLSSSGGADVSVLPSAVFAAVMEFSQGRLTDDIALLAFRLSETLPTVR